MKALLWAGVICVVLSVGVGVSAAVKRATTLRRVAKSVVIVHAETKTLASQGSGTIVGRVNGHAYVLTCFHVVDGKDEFFVHVSNLETVRFPAEIEDTDEVRDLALLVVKDLPGPVLPLAQEDPKLYDPVYILGAPVHLDGTASEGMLTNLDFEFDGQVFWAVANAVMMPGISGGTAVDTQGRLIGVPARARRDMSFGLLIPRPDLEDFLSGKVQ